MTRTSKPLVVRAWCLCGAYVHCSAWPGQVSAELLAAFWRSHSGRGHGSCSAASARAARKEASRPEAPLPHERMCLVYDTGGGWCDCPPPHRRGRPEVWP